MIYRNDIASYSQVQNVAEAVPWETKHHTGGVGELRFITPGAHSS